MLDLRIDAILTEAHGAAVRILARAQASLGRLGEALLEREVLYEAEVLAILGPGPARSA